MNKISVFDVIVVLIENLKKRKDGNIRIFTRITV